MTPIDYARHMVELARRAGAEQCDVYVRAYDESEVTVRLGETEKLGAAGSKSRGLGGINCGGPGGLCGLSVAWPGCGNRSTWFASGSRPGSRAIGEDEAIKARVPAMRAGSPADPA